jgi:hypothetical protein
MDTTVYASCFSAKSMEAIRNNVGLLFMLCSVHLLFIASWPRGCLLIHVLVTLTLWGIGWLWLLTTLKLPWHVDRVLAHVVMSLTTCSVRSVLYYVISSVWPRGELFNQQRFWLILYHMLAFMIMPWLILDHMLAYLIPWERFWLILFDHMLVYLITWVLPWLILDQMLVYLITWVLLWIFYHVTCVQSTFSPRLRPAINSG